MPTNTHPIDARPSVSLIAAVVLIFGFGLAAMAVDIHPQSGSGQGFSTNATDTVADWGD